MTVSAALMLSLAGCDLSRNADSRGPWVADMINSVNAQRRANHLVELSMCGSLNRSAQGHSDDMAATDTLTHSGSDGSTVVARDEAAGYRSWTTISENVANGFGSVDGTMKAFMGSTDHRNNILATSARHIGVGHAKAADGTDYWTQDFGASGTC